MVRNPLSVLPEVYASALAAPVLRGHAGATVATHVCERPRAASSSNQEGYRAIENLTVSVRSTLNRNGIREQVKFAKRGELIVQKGDVASSLFFIVEGQLLVQSDVKLGHDQLAMPSGGSWMH